MKVRIISGVIMAAILIPLLIVGGLPFSIAVGIIGALAYKEIIDLKKKEKDLPSLIKILGLGSLLFLIYTSYSEYMLNLGLSFSSVGIMLMVLLLPTIFYGSSNKYTTKDAFYLIGCILLLGLFFNSLITIVNFDVLHLVFLLLITILNDVFALVFGKLIGKHKLIPSVSPNKTWEGSICGCIVGTIVASMFYINILNPTAEIIKVVLVVLVLSIIGQLGDLLFSKIKREAKIKDFSKIIPGHGGILDRFDSLTLVVIAYLILFTFI